VAAAATLADARAVRAPRCRNALCAATLGALALRARRIAFSRVASRAAPHLSALAIRGKIGVAAAAAASGGRGVVGALRATYLLRTRS
jgi:hypothetical protein